MKRSYRILSFLDVLLSKLTTATSLRWDSCVRPATGTENMYFEVHLEGYGGHEILPILHAAPAMDQVRQAAAVHVLEHHMDAAILRDTRAPQEVNDKK